MNIVKYTIVYNKFNSTGIFSVEIHAFKVIRLVIKITTHMCSYYFDA